MANLKRRELPSSYTELGTVRNEMNEHNDCAVVALMQVTGKSYKEVHSALAEAGRKPRKGTYRHEEVKALKKLGFVMVRVYTEDILSKYPAPHCNVLKNVTTHHPRRFPGAFDADKKYLMRVKGHILAIVDGEVKDWSINRSLRAYSIEEVVPMKERI